MIINDISSEDVDNIFKYASKRIIHYISENLDTIFENGSDKQELIEKIVYACYRNNISLKYNVVKKYMRLLSLDSIFYLLCISDVNPSEMKDLLKATGNSQLGKIDVKGDVISIKNTEQRRKFAGKLESMKMAKIINGDTAFSDENGENIKLRIA